MGLFDLFGGGKTAKITDLFSLEDIKTITDLIGPKLSSNEYGAVPQLAAKGLMDFLKDPSKEFSLRKLGGLVKILETFKTIEPSLEGILQAAIAKFNNLAK